MATTTIPRTRYDFTKAAALKIALEVMSNNPDAVDEAIGKVLGDGRKPSHTAENAIRRISHEVHVCAAVSNRLKGETAASKRNAARAAEWASVKAEDADGWTLNEVCEHFGLVTSKGGNNYAAAAAIVNKLIADGRVEKLHPVRGKAYYRIQAA